MRIRGCRFWAKRAALRGYQILSGKWPPKRANGLSRVTGTLEWTGETSQGGAAKAQHHTSQEAPDLFERFTDRARRVVVLAQEEARLLNHNYIGTEHILLGLIHEGEGVAAKGLETLGISLEAVRSQVEAVSYTHLTLPTILRV